MKSELIFIAVFAHTLLSGRLQTDATLSEKAKQNSRLPQLNAAFIVVMITVKTAQHCQDIMRRTGNGRCHDREKGIFDTVFKDHWSQHLQ